MTDTDVNIIHYVDEGRFYSVYGIVTMITIILLLWFFVRTNISVNTCGNYHEGLKQKPAWVQDNVLYNLYDGMKVRKTFDAVLPDGTSLIHRKSFYRSGFDALDGVDNNYINESLNEMDGVDVSTYNFTAFDSGMCRHPQITNSNLRGLSLNDNLDVVNADDINAQKNTAVLSSARSPMANTREGLNNPSGYPNNDFEELALMNVTTKYPVSNIRMSDPEKKLPYYLQVGSYGGVPVTFYNEQDMMYSPEWYLGDGSGIYVQNTRTGHLKTN